MPILGSHMSVAGGYFKAALAAKNAGCQCVQIFTKNNNRWKAKELTDQEADQFKETMANEGILAPLSHASYLINLASPKPELLEKSIDAMVIELERANKLGIPFVVFHPGSFTTGSEAEGLQTIVESLNEIHRRTETLTTYPLLENTAGQGSNLGWKFEHLQFIIDEAKDSNRLGVCIDTCHTFAAGYPISTEKDFDETVKLMDATFGIEKIKAIHLNDSKKPFGSRKDRHEHIGEGHMGMTPFRLLLNDNRLNEIPMYLETEKGDRDGLDYDEMNLATLRGLVGG